MFRVPATQELGRRLRAGAELAFPFVVVAVLWQLFAMYGPMPPKLFPGVDKIVATFVRLALNGILALNAATTILRLLAGFAIGAVAGVLIGVLMGRSRRAEDLLVPLVSVGNPIPGLAYAPLFVIWFGLGNLPAVLLVAFAAAFPIAVNTWSGVRAVKEIWIRAAQSMGAEERQLFRTVGLAHGRAVRRARCADPRRDAAVPRRGVGGDAQDGPLRHPQRRRGPTSPTA